MVKRWQRLRAERDISAVDSVLQAAALVWVACALPRWEAGTSRLSNSFLVL